MSCSFYHLNESVLVGSKALAKWTRKSMQVDTSSQNQNLRTDLQWVAKQIHISAHKFTQVAKSHKFMHIQLMLISFFRLALGGQTVKNSIDIILCLLGTGP